MLSLQFVRRIHLNVPLWASTQNPSPLATLRKKTGYTFANCKKALELHGNDLVKAEEWLKRQAQAMGWTKATKLQGRQTTQGLVGLAVKKNLAAMIELNCETDFVARNENFQSVIDTAVNACLAHASNLQSDRQLVKLHLDSEDLKSLKTSEGKSLADIVALMIGTVGENAALRRGICYKINNSDGSQQINISGYAHPIGTSVNETQLGKFGGIVVYSTKTEEVASENENEEDIEVVGKQLCQHVVGLDPKKIGDVNSDEPEKNADDEKCLIYQDFLLDDSITVNDFLKEANVEVLEFKRFECGGESEAIVRSLDSVETCQ